MHCSGGTVWAYIGKHRSGGGGGDYNEDLLCRYLKLGG